MKTIILLLTLLLSTMSYADAEVVADAKAVAEDFEFFGTDFAPFPLSTANVTLIEGVWRGDVLDIKIDSARFVLEEKPVFWIEMRDHEAEKTRHGMMYYNSSAGRYKIYMWLSRQSIPIEMGIFEFSSAYASEAGMTCKSGGSLLKLQFKVEEELGEILLMKESCS